MKKPLPPGLAWTGRKYPASGLQFHYNFWSEMDGETVWEDGLFQKLYKIIDEAESFIVLDQFLFNNYYQEEVEYPEIAERLVNNLIKKKEAYPEMQIVFISDPVNTAYGSHESPQLKRLEEKGIEVVLTDLHQLRDSNPVISGFWRSYFQWFGTSGKGWLPHAMSEKRPPVTLRSYLKMLNLKANHRKVIYTDREALVSSANPHDASAYFNNIGFSAKGGIIDDGLASEQSVASFSGGFELPQRSEKMKRADEHEEEATILLMTEKSTYRNVRSLIKGTAAGDHIRLAVLYLSDVPLIKDLLQAAHRGVHIDIIFDQNKEAFGQKKIGIPNKPVAKKLMRHTNGLLNVRWYETKGEQFHTKMMLVESQGRMTAVAGSANFTRRNMKNFNLDASVRVEGPVDTPALSDAKRYFDRLWSNEDAECTLPYDSRKQEGWWLTAIYLLQKATNTSTY
ncbi:phospholipase D-like domain-containing protein [Alteribacillus sp. HJP-4]|uniref:phospholipase D-like domain-containing protein n=1 Tax=Alteribacillus sp. HJP-4 TaxID=2775394 RepID=UPI0035CCCAC1